MRLAAAFLLTTAIVGTCILVQAAPESEEISPQGAILAHFMVYPVPDSCTCMARELSATRFEVSEAGALVFYIDKEPVRALAPGTWTSIRRVHGS